MLVLACQTECRNGTFSDTNCASTGRRTGRVLLYIIEATQCSTLRPDTPYWLHVHDLRHVDNFVALDLETSCSTRHKETRNAVISWYLLGADIPAVGLAGIVRLLWFARPCCVTVLRMVPHLMRLGSLKRILSQAGDHRHTGFTLLRVPHLALSISLYFPS